MQISVIYSGTLNIKFNTANLIKKMSKREKMYVPKAELGDEGVNCYKYNT